MGRLWETIKAGRFVLSAEVTPPCGANPDDIKALAPILKEKVHAVVVEENRDGVHMSSLVASAHLKAAGLEPVVTMLTRDTNRIGLQSMFLGAVSLGITDVLVLSGYHQALTAEKEARGVYDVDSVQAIDIFRAIRDDGLLAGRQKVEAPGQVSIGGSANPFAGPIELRALRMEKKVRAGADFIITHAVFDLARFREWLNLLRENRTTENVCLIAGIMWLGSAEEARQLDETYRGMNIPEAVIQRLSEAGEPEREGLAIAAELAEQVQKLDGVRGLHFWARGREQSLPELLDSSGVSAT
jgi:methylenetetrahydrofolate reductase (NADPH)